MVDPTSIGGVGALAGAVWLWRISKVAAMFKFLSVAAVALVGVSLLGVVSIDVHPGVAIDLVQAAWEVGQQVIR